MHCDVYLYQTYRKQTKLTSGIMGRGGGYPPPLRYGFVYLIADMLILVSDIKQFTPDIVYCHQLKGPFTRFYQHFPPCVHVSLLYAF